MEGQPIAVATIAHHVIRRVEFTRRVDWAEGEEIPLKELMRLFYERVSCLDLEQSDALLAGLEIGRRAYRESPEEVLKICQVLEEANVGAEIEEWVKEYKCLTLFHLDDTKKYWKEIQEAAGEGEAEDVATRLEVKKKKGMDVYETLRMLLQARLMEERLEKLEKEFPKWKEMKEWRELGNTWRERVMDGYARAWFLHANNRCFGWKAGILFADFAAWQGDSKLADMVRKEVLGLYGEMQEVQAWHHSCEKSKIAESGQ